MLRLALAAQALYYLVTGAWPFLHMRSFQAVTGPKVDDRLVKTVGLLVAAIGLVLALGAVRRRPPAEAPVLAAASALGLAAIDAVYVRRGRISPVYLLDAAGEVALALPVLVGWAKAER